MDEDNSEYCFQCVGEARDGYYKVTLCGRWLKVSIVSEPPVTCGVCLRFEGSSKVMAQKK